MSGRLGQLVWRVAVCGWVAAPLLGFLPDVQPKVAEWFWWTLASWIVLAVGMTQPVKRTAPQPWQGLLVISAVCYATSWWRPEAGRWLSLSIITILAAWMITERGEWAWAKWTVIGCAILQLPILWYQAHLPWPYARIGGTVGKRAACAFLTGMAALWMPWRWSLPVFVYAAWLTTSWIGWPVALLSSAWRVLGRRGVVGLMATVSVFGLAVFVVRSHAISYATTGLADRLQLWGALDWLGSSWVWGWGFQPFLGGFWDNSVQGTLEGWKFYHSTWIDWLVRTGIPGAIGLGWLGIWVVRRTRTPMLRWTLALVVWALTFQSVEQFPSMLAVLMVWWMRLAQEETRCS